MITIISVAAMAGLHGGAAKRRGSQSARDDPQYEWGPGTQHAEGVAGGAPGACRGVARRSGRVVGGGGGGSALNTVHVYACTSSNRAPLRIRLSDLKVVATSHMHYFNTTIIIIFFWPQP